MAYVYRHIRLDKNIPFYIGIGSSKYHKRAKTKTGRNSIWKRIAAKTEYRVEILFDDIALDAAKEKEKELIALYGRIDNGSGSLANLSAGGDGMFDVSKSVRDRLSKLNSGEGNPFYGKRHSAEVREKIKKAIRHVVRSPWSEEVRQKLSIAASKRKRMPGVKQPNAARNRSGQKHTSYRGTVVCVKLTGEVVNEFKTIKEAALYFGTPNTNYIRRVIVGERRSFKEHIFYYKTAA